MVVVVGKYTVNFTCLHYFTTFSCKIIEDFMTQLMRGCGSTKPGPLVLPRMSSPGSTAIPYPSCEELIEIKYTDAAQEIISYTQRTLNAHLLLILETIKLRIPC